MCVCEHDYFLYHCRNFFVKNIVPGPILQKFPMDLFFISTLHNHDVGEGQCVEILPSLSRCFCYMQQ